MDTLSEIMPYLQDIRQEYVLIADGNIALNLDLEDVFQQHMDNHADMTLVCSPRYTGDPPATVYFQVGDDQPVTDVIQCPSQPTGVEYLNIFLLSKELLLRLVTDCATHRLYSFRNDLLPKLHHHLKLSAYAYDGFVTRCTSVASYYDSSMALLQPEVRRDLFCLERPIRTRERNEPSSYYAPGSVCRNSLVADGCIIEGTVENSIIFHKHPRRQGRRHSGLYPVPEHRHRHRCPAALRHHRQGRDHRRWRCFKRRRPSPLCPGQGQHRLTPIHLILRKAGVSMKLFFAASEVAPFIKTGGLADVAGAPSQRLG